MSKDKKPKKPSTFDTLAITGANKDYPHHPNSKNDMNSEAAIKEAKYWVDFKKT